MQCGKIVKIEVFGDAFACGREGSRGYIHRFNPSWDFRGGEFGTKEVTVAATATAELV